MLFRSFVDLCLRLAFCPYLFVLYPVFTRRPTILPRSPPYPPLHIISMISYVVVLEPVGVERIFYDRPIICKVSTLALPAKSNSVQSCTRARFEVETQSWHLYQLCPDLVFGISRRSVSLTVQRPYPISIIFNA